jgi:hypothetical protein
VPGICGHEAVLLPQEVLANWLGAAGKVAEPVERGPMTRLLPITLALALAGLPAAADEFTDTLDSALKAYKDNDITGAREDLDYAGKLLNAMKSESLAKFLPEPEPGWTKEAADDASATGFMGMLGGGTTAGATYKKATETLTIALVADSPMVNGLGAMFSGMSGIAGGKPVRIQRVQFNTTDDGLQGVVNGKVMVSVTGDASIEDKTAYLEKMDFKALGEF